MLIINIMAKLMPTNSLRSSNKEESSLTEQQEVEWNPRGSNQIKNSSRASPKLKILPIFKMIFIVWATLFYTASAEGDREFGTENELTSPEFLTTTSSSVDRVKPGSVNFSSTTIKSPMTSNSNAANSHNKIASGPSLSASSTSNTQGVNNKLQQPFSSSFASPEQNNNKKPLNSSFKKWQDEYELMNETRIFLRELENKKSDKEKSNEVIENNSQHHHGKSDIEMIDESREALQEEGTHHQPIIFVGGAGLTGHAGVIPPSNLRPRPVLEATDYRYDNIRYNPNDSRYKAHLQYAWDRNFRNNFNVTRVQHIEAQCQDDYMKLFIQFNGSFNGLIYSSGYEYDADCVYVTGNGNNKYEYAIKLNRCGTLGRAALNDPEGRRELTKNLMWNTLTIQYDPLLEEELDEHFKVTCEYGYDFWKTVTFPFLDVEVATGNPLHFTLTPPECSMEIKYGFGAAGDKVGGPVRVGDPLTLVINMRSLYEDFDIVVNNCFAHNGGSKRIQLIDEYGCPNDSKLMSPFKGQWSHTTSYETQIYAFIKTFRFTGSPALYIECDVRMCHGQCPSQPCYWRSLKHKRSVDDKALTAGKNNSTLSENISLYQSLRVLQEDDEKLNEALRSDVSNKEEVCIKPGAFTALIGGGSLFLVILAMATIVMCFRLKRLKNISDVDSSSRDILRPYTHSHATNHLWSSSGSAKPRLVS